jgi:hypothetical protein
MGLAITYVSRLLPLIGTGTLSAKRNLHSPVTVSGKRDIRCGGREAVVRCHNQTGLHQCSMRSTQINPELGLSPQEGSMSSPRAGTALRPELARNGLLNSMTGKVFQEDRRRQVW